MKFVEMTFLQQIFACTIIMGACFGLVFGLAACSLMNGRDSELNLLSIVCIFAVFVGINGYFISTKPASPKYSTDTAVITENMLNSSNRYVLSLNNNTLSYFDNGEVNRIEFSNKTKIKHEKSADNTTIIKIQKKTTKNLFGETMKKNFISNITIYE